MAQDVISTLFNITPRNAGWNQYMQDNMIDVNAAGARYQDLGRANIERANAMMQNAGTGLGIGIARLLGGQTPQMAQEQQVRGLLGGASFQDPDQLMMAAERFAQAGDIPRAQSLMGQAQTIKANQAELLKKQTDADKVRSEMDMKQVAYTNRFRALKSKFKEMSDEEAQAIALSETSFNEAIKESKIKYSSDVEEISAELYGKPFSNLTPAEAKQVNALKEQRGVKKASAGASKIINNLPSTSSDIVGFRKDLNTVVKPFRDAVNAADQAISLADDAIKSGNFASVASLARSLAKASGEEQLSSRDVAAFGGDPSLVGSVSDITSRLVTGTPTKDTLLKLKSLATILKNKNSALEKQELTKMQNLARISGKYSEAEINEVFENRINPPGGGGKFPNAPAVGTVKGGYRYNGGDPAQPTSWSKK